MYLDMHEGIMKKHALDIMRHVVAVFPVDNKPQGVHPHPGSHTVAAQPEIMIFAGLERRIKKSRPAHKAHARQVAMHRSQVGMTRMHVPMAVDQRPQVQHTSPFLLFHTAADNHVQIGIFRKNLYLACQKMLRIQVVRVEKSRVISSRCPQTGIACSGKALVFLTDINNVPSQGSGNFRCVVRGTIIDHNDFHIKAVSALRESACHGFGQQRAIIVGRNDDRNQRRCGHIFP